MKLNRNHSYNFLAITVAKAYMCNSYSFLDILMYAYYINRLRNRNKMLYQNAHKSYYLLLPGAL